MFRGLFSVQSQNPVGQSTQSLPCNSRVELGLQFVSEAGRWQQGPTPGL